MSEDGMEYKFNCLVDGCGFWEVSIWGGGGSPLEQDTRI